MYQALYRRYRPKTFDQLLGQNHVTTTLRNQIEKGNIGHAYLFSGTRGTGKTSAAKIFARAVNCLNPKDGNPCNECENCIGILEETIMDVIEMDAASNNSVEDIRDLREKVIYPPSKLKYKVYIIDEVHMLSKGAFNALLKTLEEPPKHLIFILATTEPERLPQTILSRCQRFDFKRITNQDIFLNMKNILKDFDIEVDDEVLKLIARNSEGAMRDALSLLDQCISFSQDKIAYEDAIEILGIANKDILFKLIDDVNSRRVEDALNSIDEIIQNGKDVHQFIKDLIDHFRNLMVVKSTRDPRSLLDLDNIDKYIDQSNSMDMDYILKALEIFTEAESQAKWSSQPRIILEMATIKLIKAKDELSLLERIQRLEKGIGPVDFNRAGNVDTITSTNPPSSISENINTSASTSINSNIASKSSTGKRENLDRPSASEDNNIYKTKAHKDFVEKSQEEMVNSNVDDGKEITLQTIQEHWSNILQRIKTAKISVYALLIEGELISFENNQLTIAYKDNFGFHLQAISKKDNKDFVEQTLSTYFKKNLSVNFIMEGDIVRRKEVKKDTSKDDPIKKVIDFFGEDIVEIN